MNARTLFGSALFLSAVMTVSHAQTYQGPITISDSNYGNGTFTGSWQGDLTHAAVTITTNRPVTILNSNVTGPWTLITAYNPGGVNLTIRNTTGRGLAPNVAGRSQGRFLEVSSAANVTVEHCGLEGTKGILIYDGANFQSQSIHIRYNRAHDIDGRNGDGNGGYRLGHTPGTDFDWAQFVQLNQVQNAPNVEIAWNEMVNDPGNSRVEDNINLYLSGGTSSSPVLIHDNYVQGAYGANPSDPNYTGGGIMLGDGGAAASAYAQAYNNQVVNTANYGLAISGGHDQSIYGNRVVSSGRLADGTLFATPYGNALYLWNGANQSYYNNSVHDNTEGLIRPDSNGSPMRADGWFPDAGSGGNSAYNNTSWSPNDSQHPNRGDEANEYTLWQNKLAQNGVTVGPALLADGWYRLTPSVNPNAALDVRWGSASDGSPVWEYTWNGSNAQRWHVTGLGNGYARLTPGVNPNAALDVYEALPNDGSIVEEWAWWGGDNQQWQISPLGDGTYRLTPKSSPGSALDVSGSQTADQTRVQEWTWNGTAAQRWTFTPL